MKDEKNERFPQCVPWHYRAFTKARKLYRQSMTRRDEAMAQKQRPAGVLDDGAPEWTPKPATPTYLRDHINKNADWIDEDMARPDIARVVGEMDALKRKLDSVGQRYTNTAATFLSRMFYPRSEYTKSWENAWTIVHSGVQSGHRVLDIGGASTPFSFYLASMGCSVDVLDNDWGNCGTLYNANHVGSRMGWKLRAHDRNIAERFPFEDKTFDRVFSICTIEHLPSPVRRNMMAETGRVLKKGGIAAITMCYDPNHRVLTVDKGLRFGYRKKFFDDLIGPSGLKLLGNQELVDHGHEGFLGAVFLKKESE